MYIKCYQESLKMVQRKYFSTQQTLVVIIGLGIFYVSLIRGGGGIVIDPVAVFECGIAPLRKRPPEGGSTSTLCICKYEYNINCSTVVFLVLLF